MVEKIVTLDPIMKRSKAATVMGVTVRTLRALEKKGLLTPIYVTEKTVGYRASTIAKYLTDRTGTEHASVCFRAKVLTEETGDQQ
jgi:predicted site-specific integrase-resolvase